MVCAARRFHCSRALALADSYATLLGDYPGRHAASLQEAKAEIKLGAGTQFDPIMAERFLQELEMHAT
jgi:HD-GYP domain-containing protein (c-di-GMP phosphodiesterase class II)